MIMYSNKKENYQKTHKNLNNTYIIGIQKTFNIN